MLKADRAEGRLRMSRKLGNTRVFCCIFAIEQKYYFAANFRQVFKDETVVFRRYFVPPLQDDL